MAGVRDVLIIDDGELDLVAAILEDLKIPFQRVRGSKLEPPIPFPRRMLVTTSKLATALHLSRQRRVDGEQAPAQWLAFIEGGSRTERTAMRAAGFDFSVPDQVHPAALRLLLARPFYDGAIEGAAPRVSVGREIRFALGLRRRSGVLVDLSLSGARLLARTAPAPGARLTLQLPLEDGSKATVTGKVVRVSPGVAEGGSRDESSLAVRFTTPRGERRAMLARALREYKVGPAVYKAGAYEAERKLASARARKAAGGHAYARKPRATYTREIALVAPGREGGVLIGRDLSEGGVRVEKHPALRVGRQVKIAVHGEAREEPLIVTAKVARDDGRRGFLLRFLGLDGVDRERLRGMLHSLPPLGHHEDDTPTHTAILAQIVSSLKRR